jgi:hypothetical protein
MISSRACGIWAAKTGREGGKCLSFSPHRNMSVRTAPSCWYERNPGGSGLRSRRTCAPLFFGRPARNDAPQRSRLGNQPGIRGVVQRHAETPATADVCAATVIHPKRRNGRSGRTSPPAEQFITTRLCVCALRGKRPQTPAGCPPYPAADKVDFLLRPPNRAARGRQQPASAASTIGQSIAVALPE